MQTNPYNIEFSLDHDGIIQFVSAHCWQILGTSMSELIGREFSAFFTLQDTTGQAIAVSDLNPNEKRHLQIKFGSQQKNGFGWQIPVFPQQAHTPRVFLFELEKTKSDIPQAIHQSIAMEYISIGLVHVSRAGAFLYANPYYCQLVGYSLEELKTLTFADITYPDDLALDLNEFKKLLAGQIEDYAIEKRYVQKNGLVTWVDLYVSLVQVEDHEPFIFAQVQDISVRKAQEMEILAEQSRYKEAERLANLGSWQVDCTTGRTLWSEQLYTIYGYEAHRFEPDKDSHITLIHPEDQEQAKKAFTAAWNTGQAYHLEQRIVRPNGGVRQVVTRVEVVCDKQNQVQLLRGTVQDVTELRQLEQEQAIHVQILERFFEYAPLLVGIVELNAENEIIHLRDNVATAEFMDVAAETLSLKKATDFGTPEDILGLWSELYLQAEKEQASVSMQYAHPRGNEIRWLDVVVAPLDLRERTFCYLAQDITEEYNMRSALLQSNEDLKNFAYIASHDLQEPLRKIEAFSHRLESMAADLHLPEQAQNYLNRMQKSTSQMRNLINDLLAYSQLERQHKNFDAVNLNTVLDDVCEILELKLQETKTQIKREPMPMIWGDAMQMRQLFQNLISNAIKFTPPERNPLITISLHQMAQKYQIKVCDNGVGFDEKYKDQIFQVFKRLHPKSRYEGTGMGLSICRKIVERHGGSIQANSRLGEGSCFLVTFSNETRCD